MGFTERTQSLGRQEASAPSFEDVLLSLSAAVADGVDAQKLIHQFCSLTRSCFDLDGTYCWRSTGTELIGFAAEGKDGHEFVGKRVAFEGSADAAVEAAQTRKMVQRDGDGTQYRSLLALPLIVSGETTGVLVLTHGFRKQFFDAELQTKALILASQLGSLIEIARLSRISREQYKRAQAMIDSASGLHNRLDIDTAREGLTRRVVDALDAELAALLECKNGACTLLSVAQKNGSQVSSLLADGAAITRFGERVVRELDREYPLIVDLASDSTGLPMVNSGQALIVPLRSRSSALELVVYGGPEYAFTEQDIALVRAIGGVGAMAIQNSELYETTSAQATELQQLLEISSELHRVADLDQFLKRFVQRAAEFLCFQRSFIALMEEDGQCRLRYVCEKGGIVPTVVELPESATSHIFQSGNILWSNNATAETEETRKILVDFRGSQMMLAPLFGSDGKSLGVFGVLDHETGKSIKADDVERARALSAQVAVALEAARNLHESEEHRRRSETLTSLALELGASIRLPEMVESLAGRAMRILDGRSAALALLHGDRLETVLMEGVPAKVDKSVHRRLNTALTELAPKFSEFERQGDAAAMLGASLAEVLDWKDLVVARLNGANNDLLGLLCIANRGKALSPVDQSMLRVLAVHASVALENSRLFSRIAQSNSQWVEIFDAISDFIVVHDHNDCVLRVNRSMAEFVGLRPAELLNVSMRTMMSMTDLLSSESCPLCHRHEGPEQDFVLKVLDRVYLVATSRISSSLEEGMQTIHVLKDITDRREAERRYRELFDNIQEGLFFSTPEGRFVEVNDALVRMLGYTSREDLLQIDIPTELYLSDEHRNLFRSQLTERGVLRNFEEVLRKKDGSIIHTLQNAFAVRDSSGEITQFRGLMLDITDLKMFQAELQRQRDFNHKILNNTQSLIIVADTAGLISYANRRCYEVGGYGPSDLVGRKLSSLVTVSRRAEFEKTLAETFSGEQVENLEFSLELESLAGGQFSVNMSPMRDEQGQITSIVVVMSDITDLATLQAKLAQTEKMAAVGQLVSGVAHEVNNPLTAILGFADLLSAQSDVPDAAKTDLEIIIHEAQRTKQIVQNLLSFARQTPPHRQPVDVNDVLRRTLQLRAYDFSSHGIQVNERYSDSLPDLIGDAHQLQQVFLNIVNNAHDAITETGQPGRLDVSSSIDDGHIVVVIADNGPGIKSVERIFDPFFTTKEVGKGTGLGLSICYGIIREHEGEISAANRTNGSGAMFTIRLPIGSEESSKNPVSKGSE